MGLVEGHVDSRGNTPADITCKTLLKRRCLELLLVTAWAFHSNSRNSAGSITSNRMPLAAKTTFKSALWVA